MFVFALFKATGGSPSHCTDNKLLDYTSRRHPPTIELSLLLTGDWGMDQHVH